MDLGARPAGYSSASRCRQSCRQLPPGGLLALHCPGTIWSSRSSSRDRFQHIADGRFVQGAASVVTPDVNALATIMVLLVATGIAISTGVDARTRSSGARAICSSPLPLPVS